MPDIVRISSERKWSHLAAASMAEASNRLILVSPPYSAFSFVVPDLVYDYLLGRELLATDIRIQPLVYLFARRADYDRVAPRTPGSKVWSLENLFSGTGLGSPAVAPVLDPFIGGRSIYAQGGEVLAAILVKHVGWHARSRTSVVPRSTPRGFGKNDGALDYLLTMDRRLIGIEAFGGGAPGTAELKKQPLQIARKLLRLPSFQEASERRKTRETIWPCLSGQSYRVLSVGLNKFSPAGPHLIVGESARPGTTPSQLLSSAVVVLEFVGSGGEFPGEALHHLRTVHSILSRPKLDEAALAAISLGSSSGEKRPKRVRSAKAVSKARKEAA